MRYFVVKITRLGHRLGTLSDKAEVHASYAKAQSRPSTRPSPARYIENVNICTENYGLRLTLIFPEGTFQGPSEAGRTTSSYLRQRNMMSTTPQHDFRLHFAVREKKSLLLR